MMALTPELLAALPPDSLVYLASPIGPACHTGAPSCWFGGATVATDGGGIGAKRLGGEANLKRGKKRNEAVCH